MATVTTNTPSSNSLLQPIEGTAKWSGTITFNFLDAGNSAEVTSYTNSLASIPGTPYSTTAQGLSSAWRTEFQSALAVWGTYANISTSITTSASANYIVGDISNQDYTGFGSFPGTQPAMGFATTHPSMLVNAELGGGSARMITYLHEIGHVLGLGHPHDNGNGTTIVPGDPYNMPWPYNVPYTIMSYDIAEIDNLSPGSPYGLPVTPMALDVAAIQHMYGAKAANTSATEYHLYEPQSQGLDLNGSDGFVGVGRAYYCIWDTGGADKIAYEGTSDVLINLNAATLDPNNISPGLSAILDVLVETAGFGRLSIDTQIEILSQSHHAGGFFSSVLMPDGDRVAGGYTIANGAVIEQAYGGDGNDVLIGNSADNILRGGLGNDTLVDGAGNDQLFGDEGDDELLGGDGNDDIFGDAGHDTLVGGAGDDELKGGGGYLDDLTSDRLEGGLGYDVYTPETSRHYLHALMAKDGYFDGPINPDLGYYNDIVSDDDGLGNISYNSDLPYIGMVELGALNWNKNAYPQIHDLPNPWWFAGVTDSSGFTYWIEASMQSYYDPNSQHTEERLIITENASVVRWRVVVAIENFSNGDFGMDLPGWTGPGRSAPGATHTGTSGADNIGGTASDDSILGLGGNDVLTGGDGDDYLDGGTGADSMSGGAGYDTIVIDDLDTSYDGGDDYDRLV